MDAADVAGSSYPDAFSADTPVTTPEPDSAPDVFVKQDVRRDVADLGKDRSAGDLPDLSPSSPDDVVDGLPDDLADPEMDVVSPEPEAGLEPLEPTIELPPEPGPDSGPDVAPATCPVVTGGKLKLNTVKALCFVTCDTIVWSFGCSSFNTNDRSIKINGVTMPGCDLGKIPVNTRAHANGFSYYYFDIGAGGHTWDEIYWSGVTPAQCPAPPNGFTP